MAHPRLVFNILWFITILIFFGSSSYYSGAYPVVSLLITGISFFNFGSFLKPFNFQMKNIVLTERALDIFLLLLLGVVIIGLIAHLILFLDVEGGLAVKFIYVRHKISVEMVDFYGFWKYTSALSIFAMIISRLVGNRMASIFLLTSILLAFLTTGRSPILQVFLYFIIAGWLNGVNVRDVILKTTILSIAFVIFFFSFGKFTGKFEGTLGQAVLAIQHYFCSGTGALNRYILETGGLEIIKNSESPIVFRFFHAVLYKFGFVGNVVPLILEFTYTPVRTNLYTQWYVYYRDYGLIGVAIFSFITGYFVHVVFANFLICKGKYGVLSLPALLLTFTYQSVFQSGLQENYFLIISSFLQMILLWYIFKFYVFLSNR